MRSERLTREEGFGLIEVVVSAVILVIVVLGTLSLIDNATGQSVENRSRARAAQLAEQEQENLRAQPVATLAGDASTGRTGSSRTSTVKVGGIDYTVTSTVQWLRDANSSAPSCTDDGIAEYLQLTTTVDDKLGSDGVAAVRQVTLLTPPAGAFGDHTGTLAVKLVDRTGSTPITGQTVSLTGPQAGSQATNAQGCAVFNYFTSGDYTASFARAGYVDPLGRNPGQATGRIVDNGIAVVTQRFDRAASIRATISPGQAYGVTVANSAISNGTGTLSFPATPSASTLSSTQTASGLFPFSDGYAVYSGTCSANNPSLYTGQTVASTAINPGDVNRAVNVTQPLVNLTVKRGTSNVGNAVVKAFQTDSGCPNLSYAFSNTAGNGTTSLGLPYGNYRVCVTDGSSYKQAFSVANTAASTSATLTMTSTTTTQPSSWCP